MPGGLFYVNEFLTGMHVYYIFVYLQKADGAFFVSMQLFDLQGKQHLKKNESNNVNLEQSGHCRNKVF